MRRRRPGAERAAVDVDDGRQRRVAGAGRGGDPGLDRAARARAPRRARHRPASSAGAARPSPNVVRSRRGASPAAAVDGRAAPSPGRRPCRASDRAGRRPRRRDRQRCASSRSPSTSGVRIRASARSVRVEVEDARVGAAAVGHGRDDPSRRRARTARAGRSTIQPLRSVSVQLPIGRSRSGARRRGGRGTVGRPDEDARADVVERLGLERSRSPRASVRRATRPGAFAQPAGARTSRGSVGGLGVDVDGPDRRSADGGPAPGRGPR